MQATLHASPVFRPMEHRWGERVALGCAGRLEFSDGRVVPCRVRDASISGAFIEADVSIPVYTSLEVMLPTSGIAPPASLRLPACVTRRAEDGFAVEWRDMAAPALVELLRDTCRGGAVICGRDRAFIRGS